MRRSLLLLAALFTSPLFAQSIDTAAVDRIAADALTAWHAPGMAVAVVIDDKVVVAKGYGLADLDANKAVTPDTLFEIASATKAFTATAMAMLVDDKKLDWDDPVRKHLTWFRVADPNTDALLTLRDLVSHRRPGLEQMHREDVLRQAMVEHPRPAVRVEGLRIRHRPAAQRRHRRVGCREPGRVSTGEERHLQQSRGP